jgi:tetratricopeptide (TPR) repeat protein
MLMIGNAYYFSGEYFRAERKYVELRQNYPNGDLFAEATIALAKTYYQMRKYPKSLEILGDSAALMLLENNDVIAEGFCLRGQIFFEKKEYEKAVQNFSLAIEFADDNLLRMQSAFQLGQTCELANNVQGALAAYKILVDDANDYLLEVRGKIRYTSMLSTLEKNIEALEMLENMRDDRRNKEFFSEIDFQIGNVLKNNGDFDLAEEQFFYVDTTYARTDASAKSNFQLGGMNEYIFSDFPAALKYYSKAKGEFLLSEITDSARKKSDVFTNYIFLSQTISKFDSLVFLKEHPEEIGRRDSIRRVELARQDSIAKLRTDSLAAYIADSLLALGIDIQDTSQTDFHIDRENDSVSLPASFNDTSLVANDSLLVAIPKKKEKSIWDEAEETEETNTEHSTIDSLFFPNSLFAQLPNRDSLPTVTGPEWLKDTIKTPLFDLLDSLASNQYEMGLLMLAKLQLEDSAQFYFRQSLFNAPE